MLAPPVTGDVSCFLSQVALVDRALEALSSDELRDDYWPRQLKPFDDWAPNATYLHRLHDVLLKSLVSEDVAPSVELEDLLVV